MTGRTPSTAASATTALDGGSGNDKSSAATGNDTLIGGLGRDVMKGNSGEDEFVFLDVGDFGVGAGRRRRPRLRPRDRPDRPAQGRRQPRSGPATRGSASSATDDFSGDAGEIRVVRNRRRRRSRRRSAGGLRDPDQGARRHRPPRLHLVTAAAAPRQAAGGAGSQDRTGTPVREADFRTTSASAAAPRSEPGGVRGLDYPLALASPAVGPARLVSTPSLPGGEGLARDCHRRDP